MINKNISYLFFSKILKNSYSYYNSYIKNKYNLSFKKHIQFNKKDEINLYEYFKLPVKERNNYKIF